METMQKNQDTPPGPTDVPPPSTNEVTPPRPTDVTPPRPAEVTPPRQTKVTPPRPTEVTPPRSKKVSIPTEISANLVDIEKIPDKKNKRKRYLLGAFLCCLIIAVLLTAILVPVLLTTRRATSDTTTSTVMVNTTTVTTTTQTTTTATTTTSVTTTTTSATTTTTSATTTTTSATTTTTTATTTTTSATTTTTTTTKPICTTRVTFDDIPSSSSSSGVVPNGYNSLNWANTVYINASSAPTGGFQVISPASPYVAYNPGGINITISSANTTSFSFDSITIAAAWRDNLRWDIALFRLGAFRMATFKTLNPGNSTIFSCGVCTNIDQIVLSTSNGTPRSGLTQNGTEFIFDNLCISFGY